MRIAVCFFGQTRSGAESAINVKRYLGNLLPVCDFFVHTWDVNSKGSNYGGRTRFADPSSRELFITKKETERTFSNFYKEYNPRIMEVEEYDLQPSKTLWAGRRYDPVSDKWNVSMWKSIYESNKSKTTYEKKNMIEYNYTIILRPDIVFGPGKSLEEDIKQVPDNGILFADPIHKWKCGSTTLIDVIYIGKSNIINELCNFNNFLSDYVDPNSEAYLDYEQMAANYMTSRGYSISPMLDSTIRAWSPIDVENAADPLNPIFGYLPGTALI